MKPSDFPRDSRFITPGPAFSDDGFLNLRSFADVRQSMLDNATFVQDNSYLAPQGERLHATWYFMWWTGNQRADGSPGRHDALRGLVEPWFRKRALRTMTPTTRHHAMTLIREIVEKGNDEIDIARDFAYRLSMRTICSLVGIPLDDEYWVREQIEGYVQGGALDDFDRESNDLEEYFWRIVHDRERHPQDELLDVLITGWRSGTISDLEVIGYLWGFFSAGTDTTGTSIVNALSLLGEFELLDTARSKLDDSTWLRRAEEEVLRFAVPFPVMWTMTTSDITLNSTGMAIPAGTHVHTWFSAANRDPAVNGGASTAASPDEFDPTRWPNRHLTFNVGTHHCIGAELSRMEIDIAVRAALRHLPGLELDTSRAFERYAGIVDGVTSAPFHFDLPVAKRELDRLPATAGSATSSD